MICKFGTAMLWCSSSISPAICTDDSACEVPGSLAVALIEDADGSDDAGGATDDCVGCGCGFVSITDRKSVV